MSEERAIYDAEWILRSKLAQFGAITRHLLSSETLSEEGKKVLELLEAKCQRPSVADCIYEEEFAHCGLAEKLRAWEKRGFHSESDFMKAKYRELSPGLTLQDSPSAEDLG